MADETLITQGTRVAEMYFLIRGEALELWEAQHPSSGSEEEEASLVG